MSNIVVPVVASQVGAPWPLVGRTAVVDPVVSEVGAAHALLVPFKRYFAYGSSVTWRSQLGTYKVSGVLSRDGVVYRGKVLLLERRSLIVVAETMSGADGSFLFEHLPDGEYMLLARDGATLNDRPDFNATVIDYVHPEPMA